MSRREPELLLLVVAAGAVGVRLGVDARVPRLVGVEGPEAAASGARGAAERSALVGTGGGAVVAIPELADLVVEPADNAAGRGLDAIGLFRLPEGYEG